MHVIRTSDRGTYRSCRQLWDWTSKTRQNLEPDISYAPFEDGTSWHESLAVLYDPITWHLMKDEATAIAVRQAALTRLLEVHQSHFQEAIELNDGNALSEERTLEWVERGEMLQGMLEHYFEWSKVHDAGFKPVKTEIEFEVPILIPGTDLQFKCRCHGWPVMYQGRLDGLWQETDSLGRYWIKEHKTAGQLGRTDHLELDPQCGSYAWAVQSQLGIKVAGILYTQALKSAPKPPKRLLSQRKGRWYSVNKMQRTTYDLYLKAVTEANEPLANYEEFLGYLKTQENPFFRRIQVHRNQASLDSVGQNIYLEANEMVHGPAIYPSPGYFSCNGCRFHEPCVAKQNGYDYQFILDELFVKRS